jgi:hypothetical protein
MFNYPVEKHTIRFYKYKFLGYNEPIIVEAYNKMEARDLLKHHVANRPELRGVKVISETLSLPIFGETTKEFNGITMVWVGNLSQTNWVTMDEFKKLNL